MGQSPISAGGIGLDAGDIAHSVDARPVNNLEELKARLAQAKPGDPVALQVEHNGRLTLLTFKAE